MRWSRAGAVAFGVVALAFWVVGVGAGLRAWILVTDNDPSRGIVAHAQAFGIDASVWWIPAAILALTAVVMGLGSAALRHLDSGSLEPIPSQAGPDEE